MFDGERPKTSRRCIPIQVFGAESVLNGDRLQRKMQRAIVAHYKRESGSLSFEQLPLFS
jgi:hypothetical protein